MSANIKPEFNVRNFRARDRLQEHQRRLAAPELKRGSRPDATDLHAVVPGLSHTMPAQLAGKKAEKPVKEKVKTIRGVPGLPPLNVTDLGLNPRPFPSTRQVQRSRALDATALSERLKQAERERLSGMTAKQVADARLPENLQRLVDLDTLGERAGRKYRFNCSPRGMPIGPVLSLNTPDSLKGRLGKRPLLPSYQTQRRRVSSSRASVTSEKSVKSTTAKSPAPFHPGQVDGDADSPHVPRPPSSGSVTGGNARASPRPGSRAWSRVGYQPADDPMFPQFLPLVAFDAVAPEGRTTPDLMKVEVINGHLDVKYGREEKIPLIRAFSRYFVNEQPTWKRCMVLGYDDTQKLFLIQWDDTAKRKFVSRFNLRFAEESEEQWQERVRVAEDLREGGERRMRTDFFVNDLPTESIAVMEDSQRTRILTKAGMTSQRSIHAHGELVEEIENLYVRGQKLATFWFKLRESEKSDDYATLHFDVPDPPPPVPDFGKVQIPHTGRYDSHLEMVETNSLYNSDDMIHCIHAIWGECLDVAEILLVNPEVVDPMTLQQFQSLQNQARVKASQVVRAAYPQSIIKHIFGHLTVLLPSEAQKHALRRRGEREEAQRKLERVLMLVAQMMQDTLRLVMGNSIDAYVDLLISSAPLGSELRPEDNPGQPPLLHDEEYDMPEADMVHVGHTRCGCPPIPAVSDVLTQSSVNPLGNNPFAHDRPLFKVNLTLQIDESGHEILFHPPLSEFIEAIHNIYEDMLSIPFEMSKIDGNIRADFALDSNYLEIVQASEPAVLMAKMKLEDSLRESFDAPELFKADLEAYNFLFDLYMDMDNYIQTFVDESPSFEEIKAEVYKHLNGQTELERHIPATVQFGMFIIDTSAFKYKLNEITKTLSTRVLELLWQGAKSECDGINERFEQINNRLKKVPKTPEEFGEMKEYQSKISTEVDELQTKIEVMLDKYELLERFQYDVDKAESDAKWKAYGWPKQIELRIEKSSGQMRKAEDIFKYELTSKKKEFTTRISRIEYEIKKVVRFVDVAQADEYLTTVKTLQTELEDCQALAARYSEHEQLFGFDSTTFPNIELSMQKLKPFVQLWQVAADWEQWSSEWKYGEFLKLEADSMTRQVAQSQKRLNKLITVFKEAPEPLGVARRVLAEFNEFKVHLPLIQALRGPGLRDRHWTEMAKVTGFYFKPDYELTLTNLLEQYNFNPFMEEILQISAVAEREYALETSLDKMLQEWGNVVFDLVEYKSTGTFIMRAPDEIAALIEDHMVKVATMRGSPFIKPFLARVAKWENRLHRISDILEEWLNCQHQWLYLEPIFRSDDIKRQIPMEARRFAEVDTKWRQIMQQATRNPKVLAVTTQENLLDQFRDCNRTLEIILKHITEYLDSKRMIFPRFYFLSDDELLEILSQSSDPRAVQPHLHKCFQGIHSLHFEEEVVALTPPSMTPEPTEEGEAEGESSPSKNDTSATADGDLPAVPEPTEKIIHTIHAMISADAEKVKLDDVITPDSKVEQWLTTVEEVMKATMQGITKNSLQSYINMPREKWMTSWPGQVVLACAGIVWTQQVEKALGSYGTAGLRNLHGRLLQQLDGLTGMVRGGALKGRLRTIISALVILDVHARDVVENLIENGVDSLSSFDWSSQLRYYWDDEDHFTIRQVQCVLPYGYEYLGNSGRLVVTPLTDRCYMTLTGALRLSLGGAPTGPAGTGKTETVKDLSKCLGKQCVVFNCSDGLDYIAMGKFFKGICMAGAWSCFDEFNRIELEVLSVIAQQILTIQRAILQEDIKFSFEGTEVRLDPSCAIFITMNPGYAGRSELPDNLKVLFRPVAMMIPDYALIAEIMLFSEGFSKTKQLAEKVVNLNQLSSQQLSSQDHYDFGMRNVKAVLTRAGNLKRLDPDGDEERLLLRALQDCNLAKFLAEDIPLFMGIVQDLFPGADLTVDEDVELIDMVKRKLEDKKLQALGPFVNKVVQLSETLKVRHGCMLVGGANSGKTTNWKILQESMTQLAEDGVEPFRKVQSFLMNPKSVTYGQLYGQYDRVSHEWTDGILADIMRVVAAASDDDRKWILFDGPVDSVWIESMNTVLDDNKVLCLISGERINLPNTANLIFEVDDLSHASPATVSRCGMVFMEARTLGWKSLVQSWLSSQATKINLPVHSMQYLDEMFDSFIEDTLEVLRKQCKCMIEIEDLVLIRAHLNLMDSFFKPYETKEEEEVDITNPGPQLPTSTEDLTKMLEAFFVFSLVWSFGATLNLDHRHVFDKFLRQKLELNDTYAQFPPEFDVFHYAFDIETLEFKHWMKTIDPFKLNSDTPFHRIFVPTVDSVAVQYLMQLLTKNNKPILFVGPSGVGKTTTVAKYLQSAPSDVVAVSLSFTARTTAAQTQSILESKMVKRRKGVYGALTGQQLIVFIDDINLPAKGTWGAQPPIELLRQFQDHGGWYDHKSRAFKQIQDVLLVGAMAPPGGGRNEMTRRFTRHFNTVVYADPSRDSLFSIFSVILKAHLSDGFMPDVRQLSTPTVEATIQLYQIITSQLLPTPSKSHYTFNMRDLAKVFQGMLNAGSGEVPSVRSYLRLWSHECMRVFRDRLIDASDRLWFTEIMHTIMQDHFIRHPKCPFETVEEIIEKNERILVGDLMSDAESKQKPYKEIEDPKRLITRVEEFLEVYNQDASYPLKLVMFRDCVEHVARLSRVLRQPRGHALLIGLGGSGRQSVTRLACAMRDIELFKIELSKNYGQPEWREDMKTLLRSCGLEQNDTVFLFTDNQIVNDAFLEDVNNLLNYGDVPNLWDSEDLDVIFAAMRPLARKLKMPEKESTFRSLFTERVRSHLHIVLNMSPVGNTFRERLRMFPSLVNCTTIDWFDEWPEEALQAVAEQFLDEIDLDIEVRAKLAKTFLMYHSDVRRTSKEYLRMLKRHNYVTPTNYVELLNVFKEMLARRRRELGDAVARTSGGLDKLLETAVTIEEMQKEMASLSINLKQSTKETEELMAQLAVEQKAADVHRAEVEKEERIAAKQTAETQILADEAQHGYDLALPALELALSSLKLINKADITEVKSMISPPRGVVLVMEAVCIMKEITPKKKASKGVREKAEADYWPSAKAMISDSHFMKSLLDFDRDNIPDSVIRKIQAYIDNPEFQPELVQKVSKACKCLCAWVRAMYEYHHAYRNLLPKKEKLRVVKEELAEKMAELETKRASLRQVLARIQDMHNKYNDAVKRKEYLIQSVSDCTSRLGRAKKLLGALGEEKVRWSKSVEELNGRKLNLLGDVVMASGVVAYLGVFTGDYRTTLVEKWSTHLGELKLKHTTPFTVSSALSEPLQIREWQTHGLPSDTVSVDNAVILKNARRFPLIIDPQGQANSWIKKEEKANNLNVKDLNSEDLLRTLENCIQYGVPVLLENVNEDLDKALDPILGKEWYLSGGRKMIKVGDSTFDWSDEFRFYITTKLANPHYTPEISTKVCLLNFTITPSGLEEQLLGIVVSKEKPELEEQKNEVVVTIAELRRTLKTIEDKILGMLQASQGSLLDDEALIEMLSESKKTGDEVEVKVAEAEVTEREVDTARNDYRPVAKRSSVLYFCVADLNAVDPMYQYSLDWFNKLFAQSIGMTPQSEDFEERQNLLNETFLYELYCQVQRGLFEQDKPLFSFLLAVRFAQFEERIDPLEYRYLLTGDMTVGDAKEVKNPAADWMTNKVWKDIVGLAKLPAFEGFEKDLMFNVKYWKEFFESPEPHRAKLPGEWDDKLDTFQKILVTRCLRQDKILEATQDYVIANLGQKFVEPPDFDLHTVWKSSTALSPIIFILSPGSNPVAEIQKVAARTNFSRRLKMVSLGQGQGERAKNIIDEALDRGSWVLLQNCHLAASWMGELEKIVLSIPPERVHHEFRLWLTSSPSESFPVSVLQMGIKLTQEPPRGIRANMLRSYAQFEEVEFNKQPKPWRQMLFGLHLFHAVVQERRKFGPLGWNIPYDFNDSDLQISHRQLLLFLEEHGDVPYPALKYVTAYVNYGGRVTDFLDQRCLDTLLDEYYNPSIFKEGFKFTADGTYRVPKGERLSEYQEYVKDLPLNDPPALFGMHENADITFATNSATRFLETLLLFQPRNASAASGGSQVVKSRDEVAMEISADILKKLPNIFNLEEIERAHPVIAHNSYSTVLLQECQRYNKLLIAVKDGCRLLQKAVRGEVVMSADLEEISRMLYMGQIPSAWMAKSYATMKPLGAWIKDLQLRLSFFNKWIEDNAPPVFWLSGFFFPQGFLTGTLQNFARKHTKAIDHLNWSFTVQSKPASELTEPPEDGCYISGLYLEGARWDTQQMALVDSRPRELYTEMPAIWFEPVVKPAPSKVSSRKAQAKSAGSKRGDKSAKNTYSCPVYKTLARHGTLSTTGISTNYVLSVDLPSLRSSEHQIRCGVALICQLSE